MLCEDLGESWQVCACVGYVERLFGCMSRVNELILPLPQLLPSNNVQAQALITANAHRNLSDILLNILFRHLTI